MDAFEFARLVSRAVDKLEARVARLEAKASPDAELQDKIVELEKELQESLEYRNGLLKKLANMNKYATHLEGGLSMDYIVTCRAMAFGGPELSE